MNEVPSFSYDQVPYPNLSHSTTHPDLLATNARMAGMQPAPVDHCRVLELGCAAGGNLMPMAYALPESEFIGIDLSETQVEDGKKRFARLGLKNLDLRAMDIMAASQELGKFDYIIAHGVYSWVPQPVREKILEIFRENLKPQGVAHVSYNTYPGWHSIAIARDLMRYHTRTITEPVQRVAEARRILRTVAEAGSPEKSSYFYFLNMYTDFLDGTLNGRQPKEDSALLHDELEEINQPFYFYQFMEAARQHNLQFLAEAVPARISDLSQEGIKAIRELSGDVLEMEQYLDFLTNSTFRQTLLVHDDVPLQRSLRPGILRSLFIASRSQPVPPSPPLQQVMVEKFQVNEGPSLSIDHPLSKAAMHCLSEAWPKALRFEELLGKAYQMLGEEAGMPVEHEQQAKDEQVLSANLLKASHHSTNLVEFHTLAVQLAAAPGNYPHASDVARLMAQENGLVTNLNHERVTIDEFDRFLLAYLDGSHDRQALLDLLMEGPVAQGVLKLEDEQLAQSDSQKRDLLAEELERRLDWLAQASLFVS